MKQSDLNHLRRLLGWVRCDIGQDPAGQQQTMIDIAGKLPIDSIDADAKARLVEGYRRAEAVPVYVRDAVKALEKALTAVGRDPGVVAPRATAETRANTGFDPGAGAGREPVLEDVQIERGLAEIGVYVWGQRGEDWLAGVEYLARLLRAGEACPAVAPLQNHPDATAWPVACRDTPAAPPAPRRYDTACAGEARLPASPQMASQGDIAQRLRDQASRYEQDPEYMDDASLSRAAADEIDRLNSELVKLRAPVTDERAAFEEYFMERFGGVGEPWDTKGQRYPYIPTQVRWEAWRDGRARAALASAAVAGEAVAEVNRLIKCEISFTPHGIKSKLPHGTKLYAASESGAENARLRELLARCQAWMLSSEYDRPNMLIALIQDALQSQPLADKDGGHQRAALPNAPDTAKERSDKILRERMAPISEALGLDVMLASVLKDGFHIITFDAGALVYSIGADGTAMLRVSFNCPHAPDTLTVDQVKIISQAASEIQPAPQPADAPVSAGAQEGER